MIKANTENGKCVPSIDGTRKTLYLNDLSPQTLQPQSNYEKNIS